MFEYTDISNSLQIAVYNHYIRTQIIGHYPTSSQPPIQIPISIPYPYNYEVILGVGN